MNVQPHLSLYPCAPGGPPLPSWPRQKNVRLECESAIAPAPDPSLKFETCFPLEHSPAARTDWVKAADTVGVKAANNSSSNK